MSLFTVNDRPLKIHVECNNPVEVVKNIKLIISHGGFVQPEPDDETITLADCGVSHQSENPRFHIRWLTDSIKEQKMQNLTRYLLTPPGGHNGRSTEPNGTVNRQKSTEAITNCRSPMDISPKLHELENVTMKMENFDDANLEYSPHVTRSNSDEDPLKVPSLVTSDENYADASNLSLPTEAVVLLDPCGLDLDELVDSNWYNQRFGRRAEVGNSTVSHDVKLSELSFDEYMHPRRKRKRSGKCNSSAKRFSIRCPKYSKDENQKMVNFLIDNKAISGCLTERIWKKAEDEGIFVKPYRSAYSLLTHFTNSLRYNLHKYTNNPKILDAFEDHFEAI